MSTPFCNYFVPELVLAHLAHLAQFLKPSRQAKNELFFVIALLPHFQPLTPFVPIVPIVPKGGSGTFGTVLRGMFVPIRRS
jgi:hypothetical protein